MDRLAVSATDPTESMSMLSSSSLNNTIKYSVVQETGDVRERWRTPENVGERRRTYFDNILME